MSVNNIGLVYPGVNANLANRKNFGTKNTINEQNYNQFSSKSSLSSRAMAMPAISFGSVKARIFENRLNSLVDKYSCGGGALILDVKKGFISHLAQKIVESDKPLLIGATGESGSGKSYFIKKGEKSLTSAGFSIINGDDYYYDNSLRKKTEGLEAMFKSGFSFDVPDAVELPLLSKHLDILSKGEAVKIPSYDFGTAGRTPDAKIIQPAKVIIVDSIFALQPVVKKSLDMGVYVHSSPEAIEQRFFKRATEERGKTPQEAKMQFADVREKAQQHIIPMRENADLILSGEADFKVIEDFYNDLTNIFKVGKKTA